ncbi:hypothetical protein KN10_0685 [Anoxybacillus flavithermus NBRC 109594]|nr:hypothetical protein [Anoxybacillus sp. CHMUD]GAC90249.1 hypothetical protein KN10_0685 [Anoxybacillus flavithermus NBRC 109594]
MSEYMQRKGVGKMKTYTLTVFEKTGEKLLDETFTAANDDEAKRIGEQKLKEKQFEHKTHRCTTSSGKLILFHR